MEFESFSRWLATESPSTSTTFNSYKCSKSQAGNEIIEAQTPDEIPEVLESLGSCSSHSLSS